MTEQTFAPPVKRRPTFTGDALSQLIQALTFEIEIKNFKATGKGDQDLRQLCARVKLADATHTELWAGIGDLLKLIDATPNLPESFLGTVTAVILRTRVNIELKVPRNDS